jgi:hypothetical protein
MPIKKRPKKSGKKESFAAKAYEEYIEGMSGMTIVIPAERILDVLALPALAKLREKEINMRTKNAPQVLLPVGEAAVNPSEGDEILRAALNHRPTDRAKPKAKAAKRGRAGVSKK